MIEAGARAPGFELPDQDGEPVALADYAGRRLLLAFYPLDFSPVCTDQLTIYEEVRDEIEARGVSIAGISVDSPFSHAAFRERLGLGFPLLADFHPKGAVCEAYGTMIPTRGHAGRALVLVGPDGRVEWAHESPTPLEIPGANLIFDALGAVA